MTTDFNYIDNINSSAYLQFIDDQHDQAIETTGRKAHIFLLDKKDTVLSEVYKEELHGRIYLPHFTQRAMYKTANFVSQLNTAGYIEREDVVEMEFNFGRMVYNIHNLKQTTAGKLTIINTSKIPLEFEISDKFVIKNHFETLYEKTLEGTIYSFVNTVKNETKLIDLIYKGDSEEICFLDKVFAKLLPRRKLELNLNNSIYKNAEDVISHGALILNDRGKLYQVVGAYPRNDAYGKYISWNVQCELINLAKADGLPNDYIELIKENQYDLGKVNI